MPTPPQAPEFHFLMLAPGLQSNWFFIAARKYWQHFRPTLIDDFNIIGFVPPERPSAVTTLARYDTAEFMREHLAQNLPHVYHDEVIHNTIEEMRASLDARAASGQRFGE